MANNKFYTREKEINGVKYIAQFNGLSAALKAVDDSYIEGSSNISTAKLAEYIFKNVIVEPKNLTADDFETIEEFNEVVTFGREVMQGKFRNAAESSEAKAAGKK